MKSIIKKTAQGPIKSDKNQHDYRTVEFSGSELEAVDLGDGTMVLAKREARKTSINRYAQSYLPSANGAEELGYSEPIGQVFLGAIVTSEVETPYQLPAAIDPDQRMQNTYTTVVFGDSDAADWQTKVRAAFRAKGHPVKGDTFVAEPAIELVGKQ